MTPIYRWTGETRAGYNVAAAQLVVNALLRFAAVQFSSVQFAKINVKYSGPIPRRHAVCVLRVNERTEHFSGRGGEGRGGGALAGYSGL